MRDTGHIVDPTGGANQIRVRDYNERLVLSLVRRHTRLPKSEIAKRSGLSAQTISIIMRSLEDNGLLLRGEPQRGKVGQPSIPLSLNPDGVQSIGLKIGRRSADLILVDFLGVTRESVHIKYQYPNPNTIVNFADSEIRKFLKSMNADQINRVVGVGISIPYQLWRWAGTVGVDQKDMDDWRSIDIAKVLEAKTGLPCLIQNDGTSACLAEQVYGLGPKYSDFIYFFIGTFIGGGIVLNHSVFVGRTGNAGAMGPIPIIDENGQAKPLLNYASIQSLEKMLIEDGQDPDYLYLHPDDWSGIGPILQEWINNTSKKLALAVASACSILDFEVAIIEGIFPPIIKDQIVKCTQREIEKLDLRGIEKPQIHQGKVGKDARVLGAASLPLLNRYLIDHSVLFKETT